MPQFLALTSPGIEILLVDELKALSAENIIQKPEGVYFQATIEQAYQICLHIRLATRILLQLHSGLAKNKEELYQVAQEISWSNVFSVNCNFAIDFVGSSEGIRNSQFGALVIKDAIVDHFRELDGQRPSVSKLSPDISFQVRLLKQQAVVYLDFSGRSLFKRGYRQHTGAAPLKEHLAAAMVIRSGWLTDTSKPLVDPMCGSGTLLIEAVLMAAGYAPGIDRQQWGFEYWLGHDQTCWQEIKSSITQKSQQELLNFKANLFGQDIDPRVLKTAQQNARNAGVENFIQFSIKNINTLSNNFGKDGVLLFNPPYGERIGDLPELVESFVLLGENLKQQFFQWRVAILTANIELLSLLKMTSLKRYKLKNGALDCQLALYDLDEKQVAVRDNNADFNQQNSAFANRLIKNKKHLKNWIKKEGIECYRLYDADIPEYNVAVDVYLDHVVIHEYAAPATISADKVAKRLQEVVYFTPKILDVSTNNVVLKTRSIQKGKAQYQRVSQRKQTMVIEEYGAKLQVNLWDYLDTGIFLDHRKTRQLVAQRAKQKSLLNLFAYTGTVSVQAALHGAEKVVTVDMSNTYLNWAKDNFVLNNLNSHRYQFIQADCLQWLKNNNEKFDVIFIDPPTFSNSKRMDDSFDVQRDHVALIKAALASLSSKGEIIFTNNKRNFKIDRDALALLGLNIQSLTEQTRDKDFQRNKHIHNSWLLTQNIGG